VFISGSVYNLPVFNNLGFKMALYELRVVPRFDHFNSECFYVVKEMESGEELTDEISEGEATAIMQSMITSDDKYFTNQVL
jgi:hypothetical protein